jgi:hypothetical protein
MADAWLGGGGGAVTGRWRCVSAMAVGRCVGERMRKGKKKKGFIG